MNDGITMVPEISIRTSHGTLPIQAVLMHLEKSARYTVPTYNAQSKRKFKSAANHSSQIPYH